jgi:hypothetical protein
MGDLERNWCAVCAADFTEDSPSVSLTVPSPTVVDGYHDGDRVHAECVEKAHLRNRHSRRVVADACRREGAAYRSLGYPGEAAAQFRAADSLDPDTIGPKAWFAEVG